MTWHVVDTPAYPARWKVVHPQVNDNGLLNYFSDYQKAAAEARRRNKQDQEAKPT